MKAISSFSYQTHDGQLFKSKLKAKNWEEENFFQKCLICSGKSVIQEDGKVRKCEVCDGFGTFGQ